DYDFLPNDPDTRIVQGTLQLSAYALTEDGRLLASQLCGRLLTHPSPVVQALLARVSQQTSAPWLRPLTNSLASPGSRVLYTIAGSVGSVRALAVSPDGCRGLSAAYDGMVTVWDLENRAEPQYLQGDAGMVRALAAASDDVWELVS